MPNLPQSDPHIKDSVISGGSMQQNLLKEKPHTHPHTHEGSDLDAHHAKYSSKDSVSKRFYYGSLLVWILVIEGAGIIIGLTTNSGKAGWYDEMNVSPLNPPSTVFPIVWSLLYLMIAIAGWTLQFSSDMPMLTVIRVLFGVQQVFNWLWSYVFFSWHATGFAFAIILSMVALVGTIIGLSFKNRKQVSLLLLPYLMWISFASYLNGYIWVQN